MNGKIKELSEQAKANVPKGILGVDKWIEVYNENLALLIIEECIGAVSRTDRRHAFTTFDAGMVDGTIERSIKSIKETFGITT